MRQRSGQRLAASLELPSDFSLKRWDNHDEQKKEECLLTQIRQPGSESIEVVSGLFAK